MQLSARAAYGEELRRQIEEKEREKKAKKGTVQHQQIQSSHLVEQGMYSRNRHEFERARNAGGSNAATGAFQYPATGSAVLPPLASGAGAARADNFWNRAIQQQDNPKQYQQSDFRAKNEITAPGELYNALLHVGTNLWHLGYIWQVFLVSIFINAPLQASTTPQLKTSGNGSSRSTGEKHLTD